MQTIFYLFIIILTIIVAKSLWVKDSTWQLESASQIIETPKGPIEYTKSGTGPVVIFLHGAPGGYDQSALIGSNLLENGFTVLAVSRPGYLRTPLSVGETLEQQADALIPLLDKLSIKKAAVLGFSAGAPVAFQFALRHPDRVWALVLECLGANAEDAPMYKKLTRLFENKWLADYLAWPMYYATDYNLSIGSLLLNSDNSLTPEERKQRINYVKENEQQREFYKKLIFTLIPLEPRADGFLNDLKNLDHWPKFPYQSIESPTLVIQARNDNNGNYEEAKIVAEKVPNAQLLTIKKSGHAIWLGINTKEWEVKLVEFLKKTSQTALDS